MKRKTRIARQLGSIRRRVSELMKAASRQLQFGF
jgi:hypothetical protein